MANSITAAPAVLAEAVLESIKGKLALLLAEMDQGSLHTSSGEAIERAI